MKKLKNPQTKLPRNQRTKKLIEETFLSLLETTPLDKLKVQQIADAAYITRSSFYKYFHTKYDILDELETEFIESFRTTLNENINYLKNISELTTERLYPLLYPNTLKNMKTFSNNQTLLIQIMGPNGDPHFFDHLCHIYYSHFNKTLPKTINANNNPAFIEMSIVLITKGTAGIIETWVQHKFAESPELIAQTITLHVSAFIVLLNSYSPREKIEPKVSHG